MFHSKAVSSIRLIALIFIVACHIFQGENIVLAWWFNVGVQIFLFMSGFLYGTKNIEHASIWLKKRLARIVVPYYLFLAIVILFYAVFAGELLNVDALLTNLFLLQGFGTGLAGIEHLWFLSYILLCYLITPILQAADFSRPENSKIKYAAELILLFIALQVLQSAGVVNLSVPNVSAYIIGYYFSRRHFYSRTDVSLWKDASARTSIIGIFTACILTTPLVIYLEYFYNGGALSFLVPYKDVLFNWNHTILGVSLFLAMYLFFDFLYSRKACKALTHVVKWSDTYSYHIYITHQIVILGQFSLLAATASMPVNLMMIVVFAVVTGMLLQKLNLLVLHVYKRGSNYTAG
jgi:Predicted acyltransferases